MRREGAMGTALAAWPRSLTTLLLPHEQTTRKDPILSSMNSLGTEGVVRYLAPLHAFPFTLSFRGAYTLLPLSRSRVHPR